MREMLKQVKELMTSRRNSARRRVLSYVKDYEHNLRRVREALEEGKPVSVDFLQHTAHLCEEAASYNAFIESLEMLGVLEEE